jgi:hypothetical protein
MARYQKVMALKFDTAGGPLAGLGHAPIQIVY